MKMKRKLHFHNDINFILELPHESVFLYALGNVAFFVDCENIASQLNYYLEAWVTVGYLYITKI